MVQEEGEIKDDQQSQKMGFAKLMIENRLTSAKDLVVKLGQEEELKVDLVVVQVIRLIEEDLVFQGEKKAKVAAEDLQEEDQREEQVVRELVVRIREDLECAEDAEGEVEEEVEQEILWHSHSS